MLPRGAAHGRVDLGLVQRTSRRLHSPLTRVVSDPASEKGSIIKNDLARPPVVPKPLTGKAKTALKMTGMHAFKVSQNEACPMRHDVGQGCRCPKPATTDSSKEPHVLALILGARDPRSIQELQRFHQASATVDWYCLTVAGMPHGIRKFMRRDRVTISRECSFAVQLTNLPCHAVLPR